MKRQVLQVEDLTKEFNYLTERINNTLQCLKSIIKEKTNNIKLSNNKELKGEQLKIKILSDFWKIFYFTIDEFTINVSQTDTVQIIKNKIKKIKNIEPNSFGLYSLFYCNFLDDNYQIFFMMIFF